MSMTDGKIYNCRLEQLISSTLQYKETEGIFIVCDAIVKMSKVKPIDEVEKGADAKPSVVAKPDAAAKSSVVANVDPVVKHFVQAHSPDSIGEAEKIHTFVTRTADSPDSQGDPVPTPILTSTRFRLAIVCWLGFAVLYMQRTNLSIAMVCMVKGHHPPAGNGTKVQSTGPKCPELSHAASAQAEFDWDKTLQGNILGFFFYGYMILEIPGGMLAEKFGAKHVITMGMLPVAVLTILTPLATRLHYIVLLAVRFCVGLGEAMMYPAATALWGKWSPPLERSLLVGISLSGGQFGNAFALPVGGILCSTVNWDSIFYVTGGIGMLFVLVWVSWVSASPEQHKGLSKAEKTYLDRVIPHGGGHGEVSVFEIPWGKFMKSGPFWAIIVAHTTGNYTYYMNLTQIPTYMKEVLKFNIKSNGAFSMMPYLVFWLSTMLAGWLSDFIISKNVRMIVVRKAFAFLGLLGPALFMLLTGMQDCTKPFVAVGMLVMAVGLTGFAFASYMVNHGDLAPDYAGTLFGITNTVATLPGFIAPPIVGALTPDGTAAQWQIAFIVAGAINLFGGLFYLIFASADIQPWSDVYEEEIMKKIEKMKMDAALRSAKSEGQILTAETLKKHSVSTLRRVSTIKIG